MHIGNALRRFAVQSVDVPKFRGIGFFVQQIVEPQSDTPAAADIVVRIGAPLTVAVSFDLITNPRIAGSRSSSDIPRCRSSRRAS